MSINEFNVFDSTVKYNHCIGCGICDASCPHLKDNIVAIVDKVLCCNHDSFDGKPIIMINQIENYKNCKIIVTPFKDNDNISFELRKYKNQIITIEDL